MHSLALSTCSLLALAAGPDVFLPRDALPELHSQLEAHDRLFHEVHAAPYGIGIDVGHRDEAALAALEAFALSGELTGHVYDYVQDYSGPGGVGLRGATAALATAHRLVALRQEGASEAALTAARRAVERALLAVHVAVAITGEPGRVARGIQRLVPEDPAAPPIPLSDLREPVPLFDANGDPLPAEKNNGTPRADNSKGALPPGVWSWEDSCSKDQLIGWVTAMGALYDVIADDPNFDPSLVERLRADAAAVGGMLRETHEFQTLDGGKHSYDLVIMDADGRPTQHHDLHPSGLDGIWFPPEAGIANPFNLLMSLGIVTTLWHVSRDPALEDYLYGELYGRRGWLGAIPDQPETMGVFAGPGTNFSGVNMAALALYGALRYETDPAIREVLQRALLEGFFNGADARAARHLKQPFFHALVVATADRTVDLDELTAEAAALLGEFTLAPYLAASRLNCDDVELVAGSCLALDGTELTLDPSLNRAGKVIATAALSPRIRPTSNFDARSDPFEVNDPGAPGRMLPGGDLLSAYWMLRALPRRAPGELGVSPLARPHIPVGGSVGDPPCEDACAEEPPGGDVSPVPDAVEVPDDTSPVVSGDTSPVVSDAGGCSARPRPPLATAFWLLALGLAGVLCRRS